MDDGFLRGIGFAALVTGCIVFVGAIWIDLAETVLSTPADRVTEVVEPTDTMAPKNLRDGDRLIVSNLSVSEQGAITMYVQHNDPVQHYAVVTLTPLVKNGAVSWRCSGELPRGGREFLTLTCE